MPSSIAIPRSASRPRYLGFLFPTLSSDILSTITTINIFTVYSNLIGFITVLENPLHCDKCGVTHTFY